MADTAKKEEVVADKPPADADAEGADGEGFGDSELMDSVTKDEWKSIEASLSYTKKTVSEMLKRACSQVRMSTALWSKCHSGD